MKSLNSLSWLCSKKWSETADGLHSTLFPVKCDIYVLTRSYVKMALSFAVLSNIAITAQKHKNLFTKWDISKEEIEKAAK